LPKASIITTYGSRKITEENANRFQNTSSTAPSVNENSTA
jgi:hypothetical protein